MVYESKTDNNPETTDYTDVLQFIPHEEGRIRFKPAKDAIPASFAYDYFIKDHLGNVRMVLTEEVQTIFYPAATLEGTYSADGTTQANSMVNFEKGYYKIDNTKIVSEAAILSWGTETVANTKLYYNHNGNPPANLNYPVGCSPTQTSGSGNLYKLDATSNKTGLEFMIKVMAGDKIDIFGNSYYLNTAPVTNGNSTVLDLLGLMTNLLLTPGNAAFGKGITSAQLNTINSGVIPTSFFRGNNSEAATTIPKAYINYIFFDEQFKYAGGGASRVGASGTVKKHWYIDAQLQNITAPKNGYIFVYVSNESNLEVFFDNLQVIHKPGPILEETHYYPFGLTMAGISSKSAGAIQNKEKTFQGQRFDDDLGLNWIQFKWRNHDPQIGRFIEIDPLADKYVYNSTYAFSENKVTGHVELEGLESISTNNLLRVNAVKDPGNKDLNTIQLNLSNVMKGSYTGYDQKTSAKSDFVSAFQTISGKTPTVNDLTQIESISEKNITTNSKIIDGKFLEMSTSTTITEVKLNVDEITSVSKKTYTTTSTMAIESIDSKDNSITVATSPISTINSPIISSQIEPGKNLSNLSSGLKDQTNNAIKSNNQAFSKYEDVLKGAIKSVQN